jgi:hypothetical protein
MTVAFWREALHSAQSAPLPIPLSLIRFVKGDALG